jgi:hypothetical protein
MQTKIQPIDAFVREGFAERMKSQFRCPSIFVSSPDKLRNLQTLLQGKSPEYPYIFMNVQSMSANLDSYSTNTLARHGVPVQINRDNQRVELVRLIPTNFEIEVTFISNKYSGDGLDNVEGFARRWLFVRRNGALQYNVNYGMTQLSIGYQIAESLSIPQRENPTDQESIYSVIGTVTLHGYVSEPVLGSKGIINQIQLAETHPAMGNATFFKF